MTVVEFKYTSKVKKYLGCGGVEYTIRIEFGNGYTARYVTPQPENIYEWHDVKDAYEAFEAEYTQKNNL